MRRKFTQVICTLLIGALFSGCDEKHLISVDRIVWESKINVLYVSIAIPYRLETEGGKSSLSRLVRGGAYYSIDLAKVEPSKNQIEEGEPITLKVPIPRVEPKPDPLRSVEFNPQTKLFINDSGLNRIREMYDEKDREKIKSEALKPEYMRMAKEQAEKIFKDMLRELRVSIEWVEN